MSGTNFTFINRLLDFSSIFPLCFHVERTRTQLEHNLPLTCNFNKASLQDLQVAYDNVFRLLMNLPYRCRVSPHFIALGMNHFTVIRRKLVHSLYQRILYSSNTLINSLIRCNHFASSRIFNEWTDVLF